MTRTHGSSTHASSSLGAGSVGTSPDGDRPALTILFDGACPVCCREVRFLQARDRGRGRLGFVDIDAPDYDPAQHAGIDYSTAMGRIHAIEADGSVVQDLEVFRRAYGLIGLGWLQAPGGWPLLRPLADLFYRSWAALRLRLTGRPDLDQLCRQRACSAGCAAPRPVDARPGSMETPAP